MYRYQPNIEMIVFFLSIALVIISIPFFRFLWKIKKARLDKENEKAILERIIRSVDLDADRIQIPPSTVQADAGGPVQKIKMSCQKCGSTTELDSEKQILFCPYCGAKELIVESDYVKEARIKAASREKIEENKRQAANEIYDQYQQTIRIHNQEERKNKTHRTMTFLGSTFMLSIISVLVILGCFYGLGFLLFSFGR